MYDYCHSGYSITALLKKSTEFYTPGSGHEFTDVPEAHVFIYIPKPLFNTDHLRSPWCVVIIVLQTVCTKPRISHAIVGV